MDQIEYEFLTNSGHTATKRQLIINYPIDNKQPTIDHYLVLLLCLSIKGKVLRTNNYLKLLPQNH